MAHSECVAATARAIASACAELDGDVAFALGLLHDVGRGRGGTGVPDARHVVDGFALLTERGFPDTARICLTHSFPIKLADAFASPWTGLQQEREFVQAFLDTAEYTPYDRLIQLCDALALPTGPVVLEKRLVDVALRHGVNDYTVAKWRAFVDLLHEFDELAGTSIYRLLPGVVRATFGFDSVRRRMNCVHSSR